MCYIFQGMHEKNNPNQNENLHTVFFSKNFELISIHNNSQQYKTFLMSMSDSINEDYEI